MKKLISLLLVMVLMFTFVSCKKDETKDIDNKPATSETATENEAEQSTEEGETEVEVVEPIKEEDLPEDVEPTEEVNEEDGSVDVKQQLLGKWIGTKGSTTQVLEFLEGMVTLTLGEKSAEGQYAIDMEKSVVYVEILAADGMLKNTFNIKVEDNKLRIVDDKGEDLFIKEQ